MPQESAAARPNIIFIVADDLGSADLGCCGGGNVSPVLDRLAREGLLFARAYSNSPVCSPARFAMTTGRWQYRLPAAADEPLSTRRSTILGLPPEHPTLPSLLRAGGYATALIGKWHLGQLPKFGPLLSGYDEFFGPMGGGVDYFSHVNFSGERDLWEGAEESHAHGYLTDLIAQRAAEYVARPRDAPFFLSVHFTAPHWPWETRDDAEESQRVGSNIAHLDGGSVATYLKMISTWMRGSAELWTPCRRHNATTRWSCSSATMAGNGFPTTGRSSAARWICSKAAFVFRRSRGGQPGSRRDRDRRFRR